MIIGVEADERDRGYAWVPRGGRTINADIPTSSARVMITAPKIRLAVRRGVSAV
jgi:hypothetical protein